MTSTEIRKKRKELDKRRSQLDREHRLLSAEYEFLRSQCDHRGAYHGTDISGGPDGHCGTCGYSW